MASFCVVPLVSSYPSEHTCEQGGSYTYGEKQRNSRPCQRCIRLSAEGVLDYRVGLEEKLCHPLGLFSDLYIFAQKRDLPLLLLAIFQQLLHDTFDRPQGREIGVGRSVVLQKGQVLLVVFHQLGFSLLKDFIGPTPWIDVEARG